MTRKNTLTGAQPAEIDAFLAAARMTAGKGLVQCSSGNLSGRIGNGCLLIKGSRSWMERLTPSNLAVCRIADGAFLSGAKPSVETAFHAGILRIRPEAGAVLHFQSPFATAVACRRDARRLNWNLTPEFPYYIGSVGFVPFRMPGSPELAEAVVAQARSHAMLILENHGQVTFGATYEEAIQRAVFFEMTCALVMRTGSALRPLAKKEAARLVAMGRGAKAV